MTTKRSGVLKMTGFGDSMLLAAFWVVPPIVLGVLGSYVDPLVGSIAGIALGLAIGLALTASWVLRQHRRETAARRATAPSN